MNSDTTSVAREPLPVAVPAAGAYQLRIGYLLRELSGQDFGMDAERWQAWAEANHKL